MFGKLKDNRGFTFIELLMVFIVLGIMAQIALTYMIDLRSRSSDVMAIADGRNLINIVRNNFVNLEDVDYTKVNGSDIGIETTAGNPRAPVFTLSPGVQARLLAGSSGTPDWGYFQVYLYHENGTDVGGGSGKKEFYYLASEQTDTYILATF
jgi:prepilin-type N-terminal cleavage/methylation domain-containing protein